MNKRQRERRRESLYNNTQISAEMTKSFEIAFTADSTYSSGVGNPRSRLDYICLKKLLKVL